MSIMRVWLAAGLSALVSAILMMAAPAGAQSYPSRPVKLVVPYAPGGPNDIMARILAQKLTEALGGQFYVENAAAPAARSPLARWRTRPPTATRC